MKKINQAFRLTIALTVVFTLMVGCASSNSKSGSSPSPTSAPTSASQSDKDPINLSVLMVSGSQAAGAQLIAKDFEIWYEEQMGQKVTVEVTDLGYDPLHDKLSLESASKSGTYDVVQMDHPWIGEFVESGLLEQLSQYVNDDKVRDKEFKLEDFIPTVLEQYGKYKGELYALPYLADVMLLYYREDLFKKYDVQVPETWDDFLKVAEKLTIDTNGDNKPDIYGDALMAKKSHMNTMMWMQRYLSMAGKNNTEDTLINASGKSVVNTPDAVKGLQNYIDMLKFSPPGALTYEYPESIAALQQGNVAMAEQWTMIYGQVNDPAQSKVPGTIQAALMPGTKIGDKIFRAPHLGGWSVGVSQYSKNKIAAYKFIEYLTYFKDEELAFNDVTPTLIKTYQNPELIKKYPHYPVILEALTYAVTRPTIPQSSQLMEISNVEISKALMGEISAQDAIQSIDKQWNSILSK